MHIPFLTLALSATALSAAIPALAFPGPGTGAGISNIASTSANAAGSNAVSDGHPITNPSFDAKANLDLDALNQQHGTSFSPQAQAAGDDDASLAAEVDSIENLFGKRGEGEEVIEKRDPATLTAYLIYCLKHPKLCRAVKVHR